MIKKIFLPVIIFLISILIVINFLAYKSPKETKIISQQQAYSLTDDANLNILLYANRKTAYQEKEALLDVYLINKDETKKLTLELNTIKPLGEYKYLEEKYKEYRYNFILPEINTYYYLEDAYLFMRLKNGHEKTIKIGSFDYYLKEQNLNLIELSGRRYDDFPALSSISLKFLLKEDIFIDHLYLSKDLFIYVGKMITDNELITIKIPKPDKITNHLAIKLTYHIGNEFYTEILPYYLFYETNENPLDYGFLNNVYLLD